MTQSLFSHPLYQTSACENTGNNFATTTTIKAEVRSCELYCVSRRANEQFAENVDRISCLKGKYSLVDLSKRGTERDRKELVILY